MTGTSDLLVVGGGIVGLAHAVDAIDRGMTVTIVERDDRPVGASVRNFGHGCLTAQTGEALAFAERARDVCLRAGRDAGFAVDECGTVVVGRCPEEMAALEELAAERGSEDVVLLDAAGVAAHVPVRGALGGAFLPRDLRVEQRVAAPRLLDHLATLPGVTVHRATPVLEVHDGGVRTGRGDLAAERTVVCTGHDLDRLAPAIAEQAGLRRCVLQMLQVRAPGLHLGPALLTGTSMLRYPALARTAGAAALRARWERERPELLDAVVNHMLTQLPDGDLVVGDTHTYDHTPDPWSDETLDELLLAETRALLGRDDLRVVRRWQGTYADAPGEFLRRRIAPNAVAVSVTSGIGMTTAFGLAPAVLDSLPS